MEPDRRRRGPPFVDRAAATVCASMAAPSMAAHPIARSPAIWVSSRLMSAASSSGVSEQQAVVGRGDQRVITTSTSVPSRISPRVTACRTMAATAARREVSGSRFRPLSTRHRSGPAGTRLLPLSVAAQLLSLPRSPRDVAPATPDQFHRGRATLGDMPPTGGIPRSAQMRALAEPTGICKICYKVMPFATRPRCLRS